MDAPRVFSYGKLVSANRRAQNFRIRSSESFVLTAVVFGGSRRQNRERVRTIIRKPLGTFPDLATARHPRRQSARVLADLYFPQNLFLIAQKNT